jgi:eukaryotic-like serine/threonine-protein kinase
MDTSRFRQIEEIFQTVAERDPGEREAYLTQACAGDEGLRREVESLLAHEVYDTFINQPIKGAARSLASETERDLLGAELGPYRIVELIGAGGMGAVYTAVRDDGLFNQKVAIKIVKRGMNSAFVLSRFQAERRILAALDHPNIARLLDGGSTADGRPYFVMEFIEGQPLNEYFAAHQLSINQRLELFRQICSAVQYAHQKLIAHRDIKPGNILVNQDGVPKLLDFGIAKLLDPTQSDADPARTATMMRMMTPDYASPEQVRGQQITTATDIYSLGAVLYELLAGARPHRLETYTPTEIERIICETEVERPSAAAERMKDEGGGLKSDSKKLFSSLIPHPSSLLLHPSSLKGDLDNILLMALRKEPERRYPSVEQFSDDLRRYLEKLPVSARPDTIRYRTGKFVRRHKTGVAALVLILISLLGGLLAVNYQARRTERRFQQVRNLAKTFLFDINDEVQKLPGSTKARALIVKTSLEYLDNLNQEAGDDPSLQLELAQAYEVVGQVQGYPYDQNLGDSAAALASFQKALALYQHLAETDSTNQKLWETICNLHLKIIVLHNDYGSAAAAEQSVREAQHVLARMQAANLPSNIWLTTSIQYRIGEIARLAGDLPAALQSQRQALESATNWAAQHPGDSAQQLLALCQARLGGVLLRTGALEEALAAYSYALRAYQDLAARFPQNPSFRRSVAARCESVADVLGDPDDLNLGRPEEALKYYHESLAIAEEFFAADPNDAQAQRNLAIARLWVAKMVRDSNPAPAAELYRKALPLFESLYKAAPQNFQVRHDLALTQRGLGIALGNIGQAQEALAYLRQAAELQQINLSQNPARTWTHRALRRTYVAIGYVLLTQADFDGALASYRQADAVTQQLLNIHPNDLHLRRDQADSYKNLGQLHFTQARQNRLPLQQRIEAARTALDYHQRNLAVWNEWLTKGLAQPYATQKRDDATHHIVQTEALLRRLTVSATR